MSRNHDVLEAAAYGNLGKLIACGDMEAFIKMMKEAESGNGYAQLEIGFAYANGFCVKKNNKTAIEWYEKSSDCGVVNAQFNLGCIHYLGLCAQRSVQNALYWFKMAADGGHEKAQENLAPMQMEAILIEEEALAWKARGINKIPGIIDYRLAKKYLNELKVIVVSALVRDGLRQYGIGKRIGLAATNETIQALVCIYNLSSATPISPEKILVSAVNNDWKIFEMMPEI